MRNDPSFTSGEILRRRKIHDKFGGRRQGGISTPQRYPVIFLFTGPAGRDHGYGFDGWINAEMFHYTGEGQPDKGDMQFLRGNKAVRDHAESDKRILLFEQLPPAPETRGWVRFVAELAYANHHIRQVDSSGIRRRVIVFELKKVLG